jgi:hypothetical protein
MKARFEFQQRDAAREILVERLERQAEVEAKLVERQFG